MLYTVAPLHGRLRTVGCIVMTEAQSPGVVMQWLIDDVKHTGARPRYVAERSEGATFEAG